MPVIVRGISESYISAARTAVDLWMGSITSLEPGDVTRLSKGLLPIALRLNSDLWGDIAVSDQILDLVSRDLNCDASELAVLYPPGIRLRTNSPTSKVPPHRDSDYTSRPREFVTAWIPLAGPKQSLGLDFWRPPVNAVDAKPADWEIRRSAGDDQAWRPAIDVSDWSCSTIRCDVGEAILFREWEVHSTPEHYGPPPRLSIDVRYFHFAEATDAPSWLPISRRLHNTY